MLSSAARAVGGRARVAARRGRGIYSSSPAARALVGLHGTDDNDADESRRQKGAAVRSLATLAERPHSTGGSSVRSGSRSTRSSAFLQQSSGFHTTSRREVLPYVILGAGVAYLFAKTIIDYRARKEAGLTGDGASDDDSDDEWDEDIDGPRPAAKRKKKTVKISDISGIAGLDLGSVYSRVGVAVPEEAEVDADDDDYFSDEDDGTPKSWSVRVVENAEGSRSTVSLVGLQPGEDKFVVGAKAANLIGSNFWASHSLLGLTIKDPAAKYFMKHFGCEDRILSGIGGTMQVQVSSTPEDGGRGSPEMLTAQSIAHLRDVATQHIEGEGSECSHMLVAVPEEQWRNEKAAAAYDLALKQAGAQSLGVERQALCALHGVDREQQYLMTTSDTDWWEEGRLVAICDVGRSVEVALLRLGDPETRDAEVLAVESGTPFVGGQSLDKVIIDQLLADFEKENNGMDLRSDQMTFERVAEAVNTAKHELSTKLTADINLPYISADATGPKHMNATLKRSQFERDTDAVMRDILAPCEKVFNEIGEDANGSASGLAVAVVGGCARSESLVGDVRKVFEKASSGKLEGGVTLMKLEMPEEAVVNGAAALAAKRAGWA